ncbi:T9SS type A sorting domain-containing protein [Winogradskyella psychrotolerans]|uniref:T9SS type A sorting domain-containing protein n=1 Tax=Winogradskyella psychrotolerans TaxID=1344585 RepID=UPI001C064F02|nr:T9SS type A sorting domain-containing protein [Winogradskyella psychrotolerans]MBU2927842.1 T9SS type A sorting domain-containing protein [Winogradskyella psychrotolerans]
MKKIYFLLFTLLVASFSFGQDLIVNGTFESWDDANNPTGWTKAENVDQESSETHGGDYSAKHTGDGTKDLSQTIAGITPGNMYTLSMWYKVESGDDTDARIWSKWSTDGTVDHVTDADVLQGVGETGYFDNNGNVWTEYSVTVTAPAGVNEFYFEVRTYSGAVVYWDDFSFVEQVVTTPGISITSPATNTAYAPGTTSVDVEFSTVNLAGGESVTVTVNGDATENATSPFTIATTDGETYDVTVDLMNGVTSIDSDMITFSVASLNEVANITELRASTLGGTYELTGEAIISYIVTEGTRNQKYIQDGGAGILIDDTAGTLSTTFSYGDGITGLKGQLTEYAGTLQFVPTENVASASSTGNTVTPIVVSVSDLLTNGENYESRLITINSATFADSGSFTDNTNYNISEGADTTVCRVAFGDEDLIGTAIPATAVSITGLGGEFNGAYQIFPRYISDIAEPLSVNNYNANTFSLYPNPTNTGSVSISSTNSDAISVQVFDILGKQVKNQTLTNNTLNVANLKSGVYIVKITQNNASTTKKLVIK